MNPQWRQKLMDEILIRKIIKTSSPSIFPQIIYYHQENSKFKMEKSRRHHPNQVMEANVYIDTKWPHVPPDTIYREGQCFTSSVFLPKMQTLNLSKRKHQTDSNWETFYKIAGLYTSKMSRSRRQRKRRKQPGESQDFGPSLGSEVWLQSVVGGQWIEFQNGLCTVLKLLILVLRLRLCHRIFLFLRNLC